MDINGLLDLREGSFYLIIAFLIPLLPLGIFAVGKIIGPLIESIILLIIGIINLILAILGLSGYWDGFNKLRGGFKYANLGRISTILAIFIIGFIILGIVFYFLGKAIKNNKVKIGGILYIISLPFFISLYIILYILSPVWMLVLFFTSPLLFSILLYMTFDMILLLGTLLLYLGLTEAAKKVGLLK